MGRSGQVVGGLDGPFPPGEGEVASVLAGRVRVVMVRLARQLRREDPPGLTVSLYSALATIAGRGELAIGEVAEAERLPSSAATRLVDRLEEEGLVERRRNRRDRRGVNVAATAAGVAVVAEHRRQGNVWLAGRLARLSGPQLTAVAEAVGLLEGLLDGEAGEEGSQVMAGSAR